MAGGVITESDSFIDLLVHICQRLNVNLGGSSVVITESTLRHTPTKEKLAQILFEQHRVENLCLPNQFKLVLNALDMTTGLVLQSGHSVTDTVPILDGYSLPHAACRVPFGGHNITTLLMNLMSENGFVFKTSEDFKHAESIKEKYCQVKLQHEMASDEVINTNCRSSRDYIYTVGSERFRSAEQLFEMVNFDFRGVQDMVAQSISRCGDDARPSINNIVLSGGTTVMNGFGLRLKEELQHSLGHLNIIEPPNKTYLSYIGGAKLQVPSSTDALWINSKEFHEIGPSILHQKGY